MTPLLWFTAKWEASTASGDSAQCWPSFWALRSVTAPARKRPPTWSCTSPVQALPAVCLGNWALAWERPPHWVDYYLAMKKDFLRALRNNVGKRSDVSWRRATYTVSSQQACEERELSPLFTLTHSYCWLILPVLCFVNYIYLFEKYWAGYKGVIFQFHFYVFQVNIFLKGEEISSLISVLRKKIRRGFSSLQVRSWMWHV